MRRLLFLLMGANLFGQVGINTSTPSNAAALEISSNVNGSYGGILPPKVSLAQRNAIPVTASDDGLLILLVNGTQRCIQVYDGINGIWQDVFCMNLAPVASAVLVSGSAVDGQSLNGTFSYSDPEGNPPGSHQYKWYRADNGSGLNAVEISGATSASYTLIPADIGKHIAFEVIPVALAGASPGQAVRSGYSAAVAPKPTIISFVQLSQSINENAAPNTITLRFSYPNVSTSAVSVTVASSSYSRLTQTGPRTIVIPAGQPSPYNVVVFNVQNNSADDNNTTLTFSITNVTGGSGANSIGTPNTDTCTIVDDEISLTTSENFSSFTGNGFDPPPVAGRMDSDIWKIEGDIAQTNWGGTHTTGQPARGISVGNLPQTIGTYGAYAFNISGNRALGLKASNNLYGGGIKCRVRNTTGATLTSWTVTYTLYRYNAAVSGHLSVYMSYSTNDTGYTTVASTVNNSTGTANTWTAYTYNINITASVPNNGYLYLYLEAVNPNQFQDCDEFAIDNVAVTGRNF